MPITTLFFSLIIGSAVGYIYGLAFVTQQKRVFLDHHTKNLFVLTLLAPIVRLLILGAGTYYLLLVSTTNLFIALFSFISTFWYTIVSAYR